MSPGGDFVVPGPVPLRRSLRDSLPVEGSDRACRKPVRRTKPVDENGGDIVLRCLPARGETRRGNRRCPAHHVRLAVHEKVFHEEVPLHQSGL